MTTASEIEAAAAEWLVRLDSHDDAAGPPAEFIAWCDRDPRHRAAYLRLEAAWRRADRLKSLRALDKPIDVDLLSSASRERKSPRLARWAIAAAAALFAVGSGLVAWVYEQQGRIYATGIGGFERVVLEDGSAVELNTDTEIRVRFDHHLRRVSLVRGQAHFKVAHEAHRPFDVRAGGTTVRAVGTAFVVRLRDRQQVEVLVSEGRVAIVSRDFPPSSIAMPPSPPTLAAGEVAVVGPSIPVLTTRKVEPADVARRLAWLEGRLMFEGQTLSEAVAEFNRYNARYLMIQDPTISDLRVGGSFKATDPESFVAALEKSFGVRVVASEPEMIALVRSSN
jgi:transmembrane sensor